MITRASYVRENPELGIIMESKSERLSRAAKLLVMGMVLSTRTSSDARRMFSQISADSSVKELIREELARNGLTFVAESLTPERRAKPRWKFW